jgi:plasmid stabilization system protein ParE
MNYNVIITREAELTFNQNIEYLQEEWRDSVMSQFLERVDVVVEEIRQNPFLFPSEFYENVRKAVINKRIILYYRIVDSSTLELLTFWNTFRNPKNLRL